MIVDGRRFLVVGHRGAAARAPENTAASIAEGLAAGADQIEIDVGLTRDGRAVLLHDTTLDRTTNSRGSLRAIAWAELQRADAGSWFHERHALEPPIDLDDALAMVRPRVPLIVEVKPVVRERARGVDPADRATVDAVLAAFTRTGGLRGVTMSSSAWTLLAYAAERAPGLDIALTVGSRETRDPIAWARRTGATALHPHARLCSPAFVGRARGLGLAVIAYTVNRKAEAESLLSAGVDGVFTDDPAAMRRALADPSADAGADGMLTLGIDQGSGGTRAALVDGDGAVVAAHETKVASRQDATGAIVQDAEAVAASVTRAAGPLLAEHARRIARAGLAVQRSSLVVWRREDGRAATPVLSWRTGAPVEIPKAMTARESEIGEATGLTARYPYGAIRLASACARSPELAAGLSDGSLAAGPLGAFLVARLCDGDTAPCDPSLAQRTLAYDLRAAAFTPELSHLSSVEPSWWPKVSASTAARGALKVDRARVPLRALLGDVGAAARALLGDVVNADDGALVLGTGGFVVVPTGRTPRRVEGLLTTLLYEDVEGPVYAVEGTVHGLAASLVEAGRRGGWDHLPPERIASRCGTATRAARVTAAIEGTGTPDWDLTPRFSIEAGEFTAEEIVGGTIDDLAARFGLIAERLRAAGLAPARYVATGGIGFSPHVTTRLAAAMGARIAVDPRPYRTAAGAALLARYAR